MSREREELPSERKGEPLAQVREWLGQAELPSTKLSVLNDIATFLDADADSRLDGGIKAEARLAVVEEKIRDRMVTVPGYMQEFLGLKVIYDEFSRHSESSNLPVRNANADKKFAESLRKIVFECIEQNAMRHSAGN